MADQERFVGAEIPVREPRHEPIANRVYVIVGFGRGIDCLFGNAISIEYLRRLVAPWRVSRHRERNILERGVCRSDPIDMKVPQVDSVRRRGLSVVTGILDTYQEFVPADWWRSCALHVCGNEAMFQRQCAVQWNRIGIAKTLLWVGRVVKKHVGAIERTNENTDVQIFLGTVLQIKGGIVSVRPGAHLGPVRKGLTLRVGAKDWIQKEFIRVPGKRWRC
jgi:hypothetical protein